MRERRASRAKYVWLILVTGTVIAALLFYKEQVRSAIPTVQTTVIRKMTVKETTICQGTVTAADGVKVYAPLPCVVGRLSVGVGDAVKKGDVLLEIDRDATVAKAASTGVSDDGVLRLASSFLAQTITAPSDGIVSAVHAVEGDMLTVGSPCVVLSQKNGVEIALTVRENALSKIKVGQEVAVSGVAFEREVYDGVITDISKTARTRLNGTSTETVVDAVVSLDETQVDDSLLIGLSAKASVTVDVKENVMLVPYDCVMQTENGDTVVYVMAGEDVAVRRTVKLGKELSGGIEVLSGIDDGEAVVASPDALQGDAVRVTVKETA